MFIIDTLKDKLNNVIYPKTRTDAVYDANGNRLDNTLSQLNQSLSDLTQIVYCNIPYTISANSSVSFATKSHIDAVVPNGYKAVGIVGYATNRERVEVTNLFYGSGKYSAFLINNNNSTITTNLELSILCVKVFS